MRAFVQLSIDVIFFMFFIYTLFWSVLIRQIISGCMRLIHLSTADTFDDDNDNEKLFYKKQLFLHRGNVKKFVKNKEYYLVF